MAALRFLCWQENRAGGEIVPAARGVMTYCLQPCEFMSSRDPGARLN